MSIEFKQEPFTRDELYNIEERARYMAAGVTSEVWVQAYLDLAQAANVLDAFLARSTL